MASLLEVMAIVKSASGWRLWNSPQGLVEQRAGHMAGHGDRDVTLHDFGHFVQEHGKPVDRAEHVDAFAIERLALQRDFEHPRPALDQLAAQALLQPAQRIADGRLLQVQLLRGGGDAALLHDHHEGAQQVPIQVPGDLFGCGRFPRGNAVCAAYFIPKNYN